jgi:hypothetical protein
MTATAISSAALVLAEPVFSDHERLALAGFLAGYSGLTRDAYALDLRQFTAWCHNRNLRLFAVRRADIELFAREPEAAGRARATVTRRLSTIAGLYRYAVEENLIDHSPAAHVRRPRIDYESHATGLDRNEVGALLVAARPRLRRRACADLLARPEPPPSTRASRSATSRKPPRTPTRAPRSDTTGPELRWTGTQRTSSPPTSPEPPGRSERLLRYRLAGSRPARRPGRPDHRLITMSDRAAPFRPDHEVTIQPADAE